MSKPRIAVADEHLYNVYSRIISKPHDTDLLILVMIHRWVFALRYVRYDCVMYVTCMYRQDICQATYVLYSCDLCVLSYMCGTMAYSIVMNLLYDILIISSQLSASG